MIEMIEPEGAKEKIRKLFTASVALRESGPRKVSARVALRSNRNR
jgi:hypothetical protein